MRKISRSLKVRPGREAIRAAAIELFAERGFAAATTREICLRARVTKPVLYYHFGSKERLYLELVLDAYNESRKRLLLAARTTGTAAEKLVEVQAASFDQTTNNPRLALMLFRMIFASRTEYPSIDYLRFGDEWVELLAGIIEDGVRRGEMRGEPREIAVVFLGIHTFYVMSHLLAGEPKLDRQLARRTVDLLLKGCGNDKKP